MNYRLTLQPDSRLIAKKETLTVHYGNIFLSITSIIVMLNAQLSRPYEYLSSFELIHSYSPGANTSSSVQLFEKFGSVAVDASSPFQSPLAECRKEKGEEDCELRRLYTNECSCKDSHCFNKFAEYYPLPCTPYKPPIGCVGPRYSPRRCTCGELNGMNGLSWSLKVGVEMTD